MKEVYPLTIEMKCLLLAFYSTHLIKPGIFKLCRALRLFPDIVQVNMMSFTICFCLVGFHCGSNQINSQRIFFKEIFSLSFLYSSSELQHFVFGWIKSTDKFLYGQYKNRFLGLPWQLSSREFTCQCRRHWFDPWLVKITHMSEQLSLFATTIEPVL